MLPRGDSLLVIDFFDPGPPRPEKARGAKAPRERRKTMKAFASPTGDRVVFIREYLRCRFGKWECVRAHFRSLPR